ncbi:Hypothetical predicted protein [Mytilus galloprovincialis]|uniref:Mab-21-like HhH/H2TH-like domain-containing protein n=1 Tax=Mytilus galloprovincialis TaxID=29158 RepID=A0A8B6GS07_MYTGA|nr:Hypothetical predicted protein [Mytilus galloprovincialis]
MSKTDRELSLNFYKYLCNVIGTEEVVKTRRKLFCALDSVLRHPTFTVISSGSKAEGVDLNGSDYDLMFVLESFQVYENMIKVSLFTNKTPIIMDISDTKPGFTKLKLFDRSNKYLRHIIQFAEILEKETYISSKLFREDHMPDCMIIHGPCQSNPDNTIDFARCVRCEEWITPAHPWIYRSRSSWPDHRLVMSVVKYGVIFVPIGCKGSVNEDLEWRISFSFAEKLLIFSFSHTQLLCYAMMKIILKDIIKKKYDDLICSYFLKTIMLWLCEESNPSEWHAGNMIQCLKGCLRRLIYCVKYKTCLHYFIPENNLFESRFTDNQHKCLLDTLHNICNSLWTYIFHTDTFQRFREEQNNSCSPYLTASSLSSLSYTFLDLPFHSSHRTQIIPFIINMNDTEFSTYMLARFSNYWMQSPDGNAFIGRNKSVYTQYQKSLHCIKAGLYHDAITAWSFLASLFYKHKRFHECIDIINYTLSKCTPDKIMLSMNNSLSEQTYFKTVKEVAGLLLTCKYLIILPVSFNKPYYLLPLELTSLINDFGYTYGFPAVVYCQMLSFLCLHHLRDNRGKLYALQDLELTIQEKYYIQLNRNQLKIANNCLEIAKSMI